jgi:hypothetical protein
LTNHHLTQDLRTLGWFSDGALVIEQINHTLRPQGVAALLNHVNITAEHQATLFAEVLSLS